MKELQASVAYIAYDKLFQMESMKEVDQHNFLMKMYHGDGIEATISLSEQAVKGVSVFQGLYDREVPIETGLSTPAHSRPVRLVLKPSLHCCESKRISVGGSSGITLQVLSSRSFQDRANVSGRALLDQAKTVMKNCKKALSVVMREVNDKLVAKIVQTQITN